MNENSVREPFYVVGKKSMKNIKFPQRENQ